MQRLGCQLIACVDVGLAEQRFGCYSSRTDLRVLLSIDLAAIVEQVYGSEHWFGCYSSTTALKHILGKVLAHRA